jgi:hypothetical protein
MTNTYPLFRIDIWDRRRARVLEHLVDSKISKGQSTYTGLPFIVGPHVASSCGKANTSYAIAADERAAIQQPNHELPVRCCTSGCRSCRRR